MKYAMVVKWEVHATVLVEAETFSEAISNTPGAWAKANATQIFYERPEVAQNSFKIIGCNGLGNWEK